MPRYEIHEIRDQRYELVDSLPDGRLVTVIETPGTAITQFLRGQATPAYVDFMTTTVQYILDERLWVQVWIPGQPRLDGPIEGLGIGRARYELMPPDVRLSDPAVPIEQDGEFVIAIQDGEVQPKAAAQYNRILERFVGDGLWQQNWDSTPRAPRHFSPFTPGASLAPFDAPLVRAEWFRCPEASYLQVRQYSGNFDVGENLLFVPGLSRTFDRALCQALLRDAGWAFAGPWTKGDRGGLEAPVAAL